LDADGFRHVKIIVSGGFTPEKIAAFEQAQVPVDAYGVGSALFEGAINFTADIVLLNGQPCAKAGRFYQPNDRLNPVPQF
jgi:nicotinate phosphoribosyltransferase